MSVLIFLDLPGRNIRFLPVNHRRNLRSSHAAVGVTLEHIQASSTLLIPLLMWKAEKSIHSACTDTVPTNPALINISSVTLGEIFQLSSKLLFIISIKTDRGASPHVQNCSPVTADKERSANHLRSTFPKRRGVLKREHSPRGCTLPRMIALEDAWWVPAILTEAYSLAFTIHI